jgi:hypothetical protein
MSAPSPAKMALPPDSDNWQRWLGGGFAVGGLIGGILSKMHSRWRDPGDPRIQSIAERLDQLEVDYDDMKRINTRKFDAIMHQLRVILEKIP